MRVQKILNEIPSAMLLIQAGIVLSNETSQRMLRYTEGFHDCDFQVLFHGNHQYIKSIQEKWAQDKPLPSSLNSIWPQRMVSRCCGVGKKSDMVEDRIPALYD
jgi:hypothetical protein